MILIITAIIWVQTFRLEIFIRVTMQELFMKEWKEKDRRIL